MIQGQYVLNELFGLEQVWNGYGTDTQLNITFQVLHSIVWKSGTESGDLIRSSGSGSGWACALALVPDLSY